MPQTHALDNLIDALRRLPGVGIKSASRMAYHLLQHDPQAASQLAQALTHAVQSVRHCSLCHTFTEQEVCATCQDASRDRSKLCIVETPADQSAVERTLAYKGLYFVLMGKLNPLDGIGVRDIGIGRLLQRVGDGSVQEVILATNPTVEGEATANYIGDLCGQYGVEATRIAHGVPVGGDLEYTDEVTLFKALEGRRDM